jgi:hypothetical protein
MTAFMLKLIASASMLTDHIGAAFGLSVYFRIVGRIAFPIYAYIIAQGCVYTKDIHKYLMRLGIFALVSQIPFSLALHRSYEPGTNIFFTLFLGVLSIIAYEKLKKADAKWLMLAVLPLILLVSVFLRTDYDMIGTGLIFFLYLANPENRINRSLILTAGIGALYYNRLNYFIPAMLAVPLILLYNGKQGLKVKWAFYAFYPAHLLTLGAIRVFFQIDIL